MGKHMKLTEEFPNDNATLEWLKSQKKSTRSPYKAIWKLFLKFTKMSGSQILEDRKQDTEHRWEKKGLEFRSWLVEKDYSENTAKTALGIVRGFFAYHYQDLKFRRSTIAKLSKKPRRKTEDYRLSKETLARMSVQANLRDRYILVIGKSLGLRAIDFINLKVGDFTSLNLDSEAPISLGKIHTQKESVEAYPFLDSDSVPIVKAYLETIDTSNPDARMLQIKKNELTVILQRLAKKANVELGNKHLRFHCLRKFLIDRLSGVMSESKWKMIVGKTVSEDAYVSELELREAYSRAMPETTFSNHNRTVMKIAQVKQELVRQIEQLKKERNEDKEKIAKLTYDLQTANGRIDRLAKYAEEWDDVFPKTREKTQAKG